MTLPVAATHPKSKQRSPLNLKMPSAKVSEKDRQTQIVTTLQSLGYVVLLLGQKRQIIICKCGAKNWPVTTANTLGTPDLLCSHDRWPGCWLGIECKTPTTVRRPEQIALAERGMSVIVETVGETLAAVLHLEQQMEIKPLPAMTAYLEQVNHTRLEQTN